MKQNKVMLCDGGVVVVIIIVVVVVVVVVVTPGTMRKMKIKVTHNCTFLIGILSISNDDDVDDDDVERRDTRQQQRRRQQKRGRSRRQQRRRRVLLSLLLLLRFVTSKNKNTDLDRLLLVDGLHNRLGFNFNKPLLVFISGFLSLPNFLQHHNF